MRETLIGLPQETAEVPIGCATPGIATCSLGYAFATFFHLRSEYARSTRSMKGQQPCHISEIGQGALDNVAHPKLKAAFMMTTLMHVAARYSSG
jgi:hypothetical protein